MSTLSPSSLLVPALLALAVGAPAGYFAARLSAAPAPESARAAAPEAEDRDAAAEEVSALRARVAELEHRLSLVTRSVARKAAPAAEAAAPGAAEDAAQPGELAARDVADPVFEAAVLDVVERERERKSAERDAERQAYQEERGARMAAHLREVLGLDARQEARLLEVVRQRYAAVRALHEAEDGPVTRREWRERLDAITAELDGRLAEVFTPAQLDAYRALEPDDQLFGGRGEGAGPGGDRGGRGAPRP